MVWDHSARARSTEIIHPPEENAVLVPTNAGLLGCEAIPYEHLARERSGLRSRSVLATPSRVMKKLPWRHLASFAFACLSLQAQPFVPAQTRLEIVSNPVAPHSPVRVSISSSAGFDLADLEVSSDSPWVSGAVLVSQSALELTFATQGLVARTSSATVSQLSSLRLAITQSAPRSANAFTIS